MLTFYDKYKSDFYSQGGEDGIIEEVCKRLNLKTGTCCEFGAHDGKFCSNTFKLLDSGFAGIMIEGDQNLFAQCVANVLGLNCEVKHAMVTPENVNKLVGDDIDALSIDIDGNDHAVWKAYTGKPAIVIIEINSSICPTDDGPVSDFNHGTAYKPMVQLGIEKGYFLLVHTGNLIFVRNEYRKLFQELSGDGIENWHLYFQTKWLVESC